MSADMKPWVNAAGDPLIFHGGPRDGEVFDPTEPPHPLDHRYEVRLNEDGMLLGAWSLENEGPR